jgi:hypothetical protein
MPLFLLPYIVAHEPGLKRFAKVEAPNIEMGAASACKQLRAHYVKTVGHEVNLAVAEIDYTWRDRETGKPIPRHNPAPAYQPRRRRRRNQGGVWGQAAAA